MEKQEVKIQLRFEIDGYSDALNFPQNVLPDYVQDAFTQWLKENKNFEIAKRERFDAWVKATKTPPKPIEQTKEELEAEAAVLDEQKAEVGRKLNAKK